MKCDIVQWCLIWNMSKLALHYTFLIFIIFFKKEFK